VARLLGKSIASVRRLEEHAYLQPAVHRGVHYFDRDEVLEVRRALHAGELAMPNGLVDHQLQKIRRLEAENQNLRERLSRLEAAYKQGEEDQAETEQAEALARLRDMRDRLDETIEGASVWERRWMRKEGAFELLERIEHELAKVADR
jgi:hypothetical protein